MKLIGNSFIVNNNSNGRGNDKLVFLELKFFGINILKFDFFVFFFWYFVGDNKRYINEVFKEMNDLIIL